MSELDAPHSASAGDLVVAEGTHIGKVHHANEDSAVTFATADGGRALVVCDGMGGMGRGDEASRIAVDEIQRLLAEGRGFAPDRMRHAVVSADRAIRVQLASPGRTPGSTAVIVHVENALAHVCWAGDSRAYWIRGNHVLERTRDHKLVNELVAAGELTEAEAKHSSLAHVVTKALGGRDASEPAIQPDVLRRPWKLRRGDYLLLCSDGLCDLVEDAEIASVVDGIPPDQAIEVLIQLALDRGGHDNITVVLARWDGEDFDEDEKQTPIIGGPRERARPIASPYNQTWEPLDGPYSEDIDDPSTVDVPPPGPDDHEDDTPDVDPASLETVPPPPERTPTPPGVERHTPSAAQRDARPQQAPPEPAPPTEQPRPMLAWAVAVIAVALIAIAIAIAQGAFSSAGGVQVAP